MCVCVYIYIYIYIYIFTYIYMYTHTHIHTYTSIKKNHIAVYLKLTQYFKLSTLQFNEKTRTTTNLENNHQKK